MAGEPITTFEQLCAVLNRPEYVVIHVYADTCELCKAMAHGNINIHAMCEFLKAWIRQMHVTSVPTCLVFKDNQEVQRVAGCLCKITDADALKPI